MNKHVFITLMGSAFGISSVIFSGGQAYADNRIAACFAKPPRAAVIIKDGLDSTENLGTAALNDKCRNLRGTLIILSKEGATGPQGPQGLPGPAGAAIGAGEPDCPQPTRGDNVVGCNFARLVVTNADLFVPAQNDLRGIKAIGATFNGLHFDSYNFINADFTAASLVGAVMSNNDFVSDLSYANFSGASLNNTDFGFGTLKFANFTGATLAGSKFDGANLCGATFSLVNLVISGNPAITWGQTTVCPNNQFTTEFGIIRGASGNTFSCVGTQLVAASECVAASSPNPFISTLR